MGSKGRCTWSVVLATAGLFFSFGLVWSADPSLSKADPTLSKGIALSEDRTRALFFIFGGQFISPGEDFLCGT
jgi:hypothetical protein